jgi:large subunit ribosomal protein L18
MALTKEGRRTRIKFRIKKRLAGSIEIPRISVFRSNADIYAQIIDDSNGKTIVAASSRDKNLSGQTGNKTEISKQVGIALAEKAKSKGISTCVFDRNGYLYHGRVKALAEGAREGGLNF